MGTRGTTGARAGASPDAGTTGDLFAAVPSAARGAPGAAPAPRPARLPSPTPAPAAGPAAAPPPSPRHAWLALRLPGLALEVVAPGVETPVAVLEGAGSRRLVIACNASAAQRGIRPGLALPAAHALVPGLGTRERDPAAEERRLQSLARWAVGFTPCVSPEPPDTLLLEVRGSLRLFGGAAALVERATRELRALGHAVMPALAPTPRAALWLSRAATAFAAVDSVGRLAGVLAALPVACAGWPPAVNELLVRCGVRTLGELRRLPRDGLARRLPAFVLEELDEAYGLRPAVRRRHVAPERFQERLELSAELDTVAHLEPALDRLLERMGRFLRVRDAAVAQLLVTFVHREHPPTRVPLGRGLPSGAAEAWRSLLHERLARVQLPAPVLAVALRTGVARPQPAACAALPGLAAPGHDDGAGAALLLDRLRARLGERAVQGVCLVPEHRPEAAWRRVRPTLRTAPPAQRGPCAPSAPPLPLAPRPLWLLADPERLAVREGQPYHHGFLRVEAGPERIESGWWDGVDVVRDYYVVVARSGARLWIYREPAGEAEVRWFLHGVFG